MRFFNVENSLDYYSLGMLIPERFGDGDYRYGFQGQEKDDEIKGSDNHLSLGDYGYDPRLGRRWCLDPRIKDIPSWNSYTYSLDNPIMFTDETGERPRVTYFYFELDVGGGLGYGLNYVEQTGIAYDEVGKTHFTMSSSIYITNQNFEEDSHNAEFISGASISLSAGITFDWSNETFLGDICGYNSEMGGFEFYPTIGGEFSFGENRVSFKAGVGGGVKLLYINTKIKTSISLTDAEANTVNDATDVVAESWILNGIDYNEKTKLWEGTVATKNTKGEIVDTGIKVSSANVVNDDGTNVPSGIWTSQSYRTEVAKAEKED